MEKQQTEQKYPLKIDDSILELNSIPFNMHYIECVCKIENLGDLLSECIDFFLSYRIIFETELYSIVRLYIGSWVATESQHNFICIASSYGVILDCTFSKVNQSSFFFY